jgi:hypothetical protein
MIFHLLYISELSPPFENSIDVTQIIETSQRNNKTNGLTGILISNGNHFIQLLEGKEEAVLRTYQVIAKDPRHIKLRTLMTYKDHVRIFPNWSMGLAQKEKDKISLQELIPLIHSEILKLEGSKERAISVLKKFNHL